MIRYRYTGTPNRHGQGRNCRVWSTATDPDTANEELTTWMDARSIPRKWLGVTASRRPLLELFGSSLGKCSPTADASSAEDERHAAERWNEAHCTPSPPEAV